MNDALHEILQEAGLTNEEGDLIEDFETRGRDSLDFTSVSRTQLRNLLQAAYEAGRDRG